MAALACASRRPSARRYQTEERRLGRFGDPQQGKTWVRKDGAFEKAGVKVITKKSGGGSGARLKAPKAKGKRKLPLRNAEPLEGCLIGHR